MKTIVVLLSLISLALCQKLPSIALIHAESASPSWVTDVFNKLSKYYTVTQISGAAGTPSYTQLTQYSAVLVWCNYPFSSPSAMGSVLRQYVDAGYGVVLAMFSLSSNSALSGNWTNDYYAILPGITRTGLGILVPLSPGHPILAGVNSFSGGSSSYRTGTWNSNAQQVAQWNDGTPLVGAIKVRNTMRVDLAMYPVSSDMRYDFWNSSTDGARLMANAISYTMNGGGGCGQFGDCFSCASNKCQWCLDSEVCQPISTDCPDTIENPADCPITCNQPSCSTCVAPNQQGQCSWCLDLKQCVPKQNSKNCHGVINNQKFCPSSLGFN